jgi:hypothetical protein
LVPEAEAKPSIPIAVYEAAKAVYIDAEGRLGTSAAVIAAIESAFAAGRAQAATDIRAEAERWDRLGYSDEGAWVAAARIAAGGGVADLSKDHS